MPAFLALVFLTVSTVVASASPSNLDVDLDLITLIHQSAIPRPETFTNALRIIGSLETSPSCHRIATSTLIDSCQLLEAIGESHDKPNVALDSVKSIYAARLAVCELQGASALVPSECLIMVPRPQSNGFKCMLPGRRCQDKKASGILQHPDVSQRQIGKCLKALESRPQWWTSYSNARQNAVVICQAARSELEKDELLSLHKSMAGVTWDLSESLSASLEQTTRYVAEQKAFQEAVGKMQSDLLQHMDDSKTQLDVSFGSITKSAEASMQYLISRLFTGVSEASKQMEDLSANIKGSSQEVRSTRNEVSDLLQDVVRNTAELTMSQTTELRGGQEAALALRESLETISRDDLHVIAVALAELRSTVLASTQLASLLHTSHSSLSTDLQSLTSQITTLSTQFELLQTSHLATEASQQRMHTALASRLNATSDMLEGFSVTVADLTGSVQATIKQVREVDLFGLSASVLGFGKKLKMGLFVVGVGAALAVLCRRAAALFVLGVGISYTLISVFHSGTVASLASWMAA